MRNLSYNLTRLEQYKLRLIEEDDSVLGLDGIKNIVGDKSLDELSKSELKHLLKRVFIILYSSEVAYKLDQQGLLNIGLCPECGISITNEVFWKYPNSNVKLFMCEPCWIQKQKENLTVVGQHHPKSFQYKYNIKNYRKKSIIKFLYNTTHPAIFGFLIITVVQLVRAIFGNIKWSSVGFFFVCFIGFALINFLLSFGVKDRDL